MQWLGRNHANWSCRALNHARQLLKLINTFPTSNTSQTASDASSNAIGDGEGRLSTDEVDLPALLSSIRARYRLLCTSLGVRPRLVAASAGATAEDETGGEKVVEGIEGPMKGVDTRKLLY